ncbi:MAG: undecaprenyldiphospho-muramoylpentapeptide beta-N-acetylglucosaminyltransferase [Candidatus Omnitrophica bacterium]|nr:undecaprenyldiphospho-muramoylpentapeptide beta-N-acetylglucosaminyltransferase [Candidatus Omnitrophota bacterium]
MNKVLIVAGGSGGHIFPAVSTAQTMIKKGWEVVFVASKRRIDKKLLKDTNYKKYYLSANPMPYKFSLKMFSFMFKFVSDVLISFFILIREKPNVVVGFGGYVTGAVVFLAKVFHIKTVIHEQNIVLGRANQILSKYVDKIALSFPSKIDSALKEKICITGNPIRPEILSDKKEDLLKVLSNEQKTVKLLVIGGSQGATSMNKIVVNDLSLIEDSIKAKLEIIHIAGDKDVEYVQNTYLQHNIIAKVYNYVENINNIYKIVDIAISRAGASAVFELAFYGIPMILIPYPNEKNSQILNAKFFADKKAAVLLEEKNMSQGQIKNIVSEWVKNRHIREEFIENARNIVELNASQKLSEVIIDILKR